MRNEGQQLISKKRSIFAWTEAEYLITEGNKEIRIFKEYKYLERTLNRDG